MVEKLNMKIHGYDEASHSLIVSFSTDESVKNVDEYQKMAFNPASIVGTPEETLKKIAQRGLQTAIGQDKKDAEIADNSVIDAYKSLVGQTFTYDVADITPPPSDTNLTDLVNV